MDGTPFCSGSQSLQTQRVKSGQIVDLLHPYTLLLCRVEAKLVRLKKEL